MARTKARHRTAEQQAAWEAQEAADAREAAATRARRRCRASSDAPASDEEFILPVPSTGLEAPSDHLTGRRRKTKLVLVVILATMAMGSRGALWKRERILWQDYCGSMLQSEFTRMFRMDPPTFAYLVGALSPRIDRNFVQAERAGGYISPELRVAMTIRWLAGGSYLDLKVHMGQTADESVFSFYHSSLRMCVECSFGILVARWGILWKPLKVSLRQAPKIVGTCMCLHNVMMDRCVPQEIRPPVYSKSGRVTYRPHIDNNGAPTQLMTYDGAESTADCVWWYD